MDNSGGGAGRGMVLTDSARGAGQHEVVSAYREHYLRLVRLAVQLVDDQETAEDLVQDVFLALHRGGAATPDDLRRYLTTAVMNRSRSALRRRKVARSWVAPKARTAPPADSTALANDLRHDVMRIVAGLPRRQREVVVLRFYEDLGVAEIATVLGISGNAVSSSLTRALAALATTLGATNA